MKYEVFLPDIRLKNVIQCYVVIYDISLLNGMIFLPTGGNFIVFNRGISGYSVLHNNKKYQIPKGYSASIKTTKSIKTVLDLKNIPFLEPAVFILAELLPIGFYKLFRLDASYLNNQYLPIEETLINKYFSKLYMHKSLEQDIAYLNKTLLQMNNDCSNSKEYIEEMMTKIAGYNYEINVNELAKEFGYHRRTIERKFKKFIGISPKNFIFICKFYQTFMAYVKDEKKLKDIEYIYNCLVSPRYGCQAS